MKKGIISYGVYVPRYYLETRVIDEKAITLGLEKKALGEWDEDAVTMGLEAAKEAVEKIAKNRIKIVYFGSESSPYAVKPVSVIIGDMLGLSQEAEYLDLQFACKAGAGGLRVALEQVQKERWGLVVAADKSQAKKGDALELSAGAGGGAVVVGEAEEVVAEIKGVAEVNTDTPDFWRKEGMAYPNHGGRFTGEPAYFTHVIEAVEKVCHQGNFQKSDFERVILHMPNVKFPLRVAKKLGFTDKQINTALTVKEIGNPYTASTFVGLGKALAEAKEGQLILQVAYGSGAGAIAFVWQVGARVEQMKIDWQEKMTRRVKVSWREYREEARWE